MTTCTMVKPATGTWCDTFPKQQMTEQESLRFVKKLLAIAVSNIAYLRVILPENAFVDRSVEGVNLKILKCDKSCPGVPLLVDWLKGAFDALEKKYLRVLILGIYLNEDDPSKLIEAYTFKFSYSEMTTMDIYKNNQKISSSDTSNKTKQATVGLLRTLIVLMGTLNPLPQNYMVTMKLLYYDKVTPLDYEPPGFKAADTDSLQFEDKPMKIRAGDVSTLFHALKVRVTTVSSNFKGDVAIEDDDKRMTLEGLDVEDEDQGGHSWNTQESHLDQSQDKSQPDSQQKCQAKLNNKENIEADDQLAPVELQPSQQLSATQKPRASGRAKKDLMAPAAPVSSSQQQSETSPSLTPSAMMQPNETHEADEFGVRCPCGCSEDDGLMVLCAICGHWQHGICFLIPSADDAPEQHICDICSDPSKSSLQPTDQTLVGLSSEDLQMTCLWRRALVACTEEKFVTLSGLSNRLGVDKNVVAKVMQRLEDEEYLKPARGKLARQAKSVNVDRIEKVGIPKYFHILLPTENNQGRDDLKSEKIQQNYEPESETPAQTTEKDIGMIVSQTSKLNVSSVNGTKASKTARSDKTKVNSATRSDVNKSQEVKKPVPLNRGKRQKAALADVYDFEFSNTQEDFECGPLPGKRKKASVTSRDLKA